MKNCVLLPKKKTEKNFQIDWNPIQLLLFVYIWIYTSYFIFHTRSVDISSCVLCYESFETSLTLLIFEHLNITLIKCIDIGAQVYFSIQQTLSSRLSIPFEVNTEHIVHSTKYCDRHYRYIYDVDKVEFSSLLKIKMFSGFRYIVSEHRIEYRV